MNRILLLALVALIGAASASVTFAGTTDTPNQVTDSRDDPIEEIDEESDDDAE